MVGWGRGEGRWTFCVFIDKYMQIGNKRMVTIQTQRNLYPHCILYNVCAGRYNPFPQSLLPNRFVWGCYCPVP
mgnify:FL=1